MAVVNVDAMSHLGGEDTQRDRQMRFTYTGRTEKHDIAAFVQETSGSEFVNQSLVDGRMLVKVERVETFLIGQVGELQIQTHGLVVTEAQFGIE